MANMSMKDYDKFGDVIPVGNNILVEVVKPEDTTTLKSGIIVDSMLERGVERGESKPFFVVRKIPETATITFGIEVGDIIHMAGGHYSYILGKNKEQLIIINVATILGVQKKPTE